ncbi:GNAT family protein [Paenibacillus filicis]|uniref:GNAT family protein n=1 Tax=Paenibacillus gyeongsangnamensis TaxID=3388067 RepID=A0ABT4Q7G1_9BACL|nr:GNAT family protein [Paenibacillus filicis]MCZ8512807.1 GNAT family protein [Paenibacillus filicis]
MSPGEQGQGNGRRLLQALIYELRTMEGLEQVLLTVVSANIPAVKLYEKLGFVRYGTEPRALLVDGDYVDEALMALRMG